jgi:predicted nucleic acid-binding protein
MGKRFLIDTNIVIAALGDKLPPKGGRFIKEIPSAISVISQIELLGWAGASPEELTVLNNYIERSLVYPLTPAIINQCIILRREIKIKIPDAIIAATALVEGLLLLTRNVDDFKNVNGLEIVNPFQL